MLILAQGIILAISLAAPDFDMPSSVGIIVTLVAALTAGKSFAKSAGREPDNGEKMRFSLISLVISLALTILGLAAMMAWYGVPPTPGNLAMVRTGDGGIAGQLGGWIWLILAFGLFIGWSVCYFGFGAGAKGYVKAQAKQAAREAGRR